MKHYRLSALLLAILLLAACRSTTQPDGAAAQAREGATVAPAQTAQVTTPEQAVLAAMQAQFDLNADQISILSVVEGEWPDACLGMPAADEACAQIVTPGYVVTLEAGGALYIYNVDRALTTVRLVAAPEA